jgi:DNA repair protein SbcD/Mre11
MFQFIHAADIHLDSPLVGLERYEGAPVEEIRLATRRALEKLVDLALQKQVAFMIIAGDLFDGDWKDYNTGLFFARQMSRLREKSIPVYIVKGNHDATNKVTKSLPMPENVFVFSDARPETFHIDDCHVAIHGQSFSTTAVKENLSLAYPQAERDRFNIGVLHTCADGKEGHAPYAPCKISELVDKGYDYWALGHVHKREVLSEEPLIIFPGNLQGRHIIETGAKGCTLVTVDERNRASAEAIELSVLRWEHCLIDVAGASSEDDVIQIISTELGKLLVVTGEIPLAVRVEISGACAADAIVRSRLEHFINQVRAVATDISRERIWVEKVKIKTTPESGLTSGAASDFAAGSSDVTGLNLSEGPVGELMQMIAEYQEGGARLAELRDELADLERKLPEEVKKTLGIMDDDFFKDVLSDVQDMLLDQLAQAK